jgi:hypothetical protein
MPNHAELNTLRDFPKYVCRNPVNLCCKWDHDPFVKWWSPTEKCGGRSAGHLGSRAGKIDPQNRCSFHDERATLPPTMSFAS